MDKAKLIESVKKQIREAKTESALELLLAWLATDKNYQTMHRTVLQLLSQWQRTKQDETLGIISFENARLIYNQTTHQALMMLEQLEKGATSRPVARMQPRWLWIVAAAIILGVAGFFLVQTFQKPAAAVAQLSEKCPNYSTDAVFNILLFRFQHFGERKLSTHQALRRRLEQLGQRYGIPAGVGIYNDQDDDNQLPGSLPQASKIGTNCGVHLVIMGTEESQQERAIITIQYQFLRMGEQFALSRLRITEREEVDTITSISSITTQGAITGNIEQAILLLFGVVAFENKQSKTAIELLQSAQPADSASTLLRGMILAESHLAVDQPEKALESYSEVLEKHPNYALALNNRAALAFQQGNYDLALRDLDTQLEIRPDDPSARTMRGTIYMKINRLETARKDLETARKIRPDDPLIRKQWQQLELKTEEQQRIRKEAEEQVRINPKDVQAFNRLASASRSLEDYVTAIRAAESALQHEPINPEAYTTLIELYTTLQRPEKVQEVVRRLEKSGVSRSEILRQTPATRQLIENRQ